MSEQLPAKNPEAAPSHELNEQSTRNLERLQKAGEAAEVKNHETIDDLRQQIAETATSHEEVTVGDSESAAQASQYGVHRELKADAYRRSMQRIQSQLSLPEKVFSKFTHQPIIERVSDLTGNSLVRPSGVIGGGLATLMGTAYLVYITKHVGFTYNYFTFILLFLAGFVAGILIELLIRLIKRR